MNNKVLIYDKSSSGMVGCPMPKTSDSEEKLLGFIPAKYRRREDAALPEVAESELMRHYIGLSVKNHHIDKGFYPLGSCTMKYNPKMNDKAASLPGFAGLHPMAPCYTASGALHIMYELGEYLKEISGFDAISLQPTAGAQGEFAGLLIIRAYHKDKGNARKKILIPDSAHGTNPASVTLAGYETVQVKSNENGIIDPEAVKAAVNEDVAAMMLTNPNTVGLFESNVKEIAGILHDAGALLYMDGANLNAQLGIYQPGKIGFDILHFNLHKTFSTPHGGGGPGAGAVAVTEELAQFLPLPVVVKLNGKLTLDFDRPKSIGRLHTFYGNFANDVRAFAYIRTLGADGLREVSENAIINANYLRFLLKDYFDMPYETSCQHEFVMSCSRQKKLGVKALDIAKRLLDYGFHSPTVYFPLIVPEAFMIEPTETETRETLEKFAETLIAISKEAETDPDMLHAAPHTTPVRRLNEVKAARELDICYKG
ncbi:MAG: glycine dehydrogenase (aminomethyl-transferring) [candidate division Zixibacteria bacterium HGW-Zixibacteria-1]|nr:MAG: glycine dehydrogenase (aminomethyl-transferring) [candidate division Zixibacteria bacterium HGW-Zixibacteria-1]